MTKTRDDFTVRLGIAETLYGPPASTHETYGVLAEEMAELLDAIHKNKRDAIRDEALDIAAAAFRLAHAIDSGEANLIIRSGLTDGR